MLNGSRGIDVGRFKGDALFGAFGTNTRVSRRYFAMLNTRLVARLCPGDARPYAVVLYAVAGGGISEGV